MGVSKNNGTPKSSILVGFSIINHPFWGTPIFGNTHMDPMGSIKLIWVLRTLLMVEYHHVFPFITGWYSPLKKSKQPFFPRSIPHRSSSKFLQPKIKSSNLSKQNSFVLAILHHHMFKKKLLPSSPSHFVCLSF